MQLYTSLVRLKQAMNGGQMPPMTPVTGKALEIIDPAFTIGLGGLEEDEVRGLRCPIRGCGKYFQNLSMHLGAAHADVGARGLKKALSIPQTAPLCSQSESERLRTRARDRGLGKVGRKNLIAMNASENAARGAVARRKNRPFETVGVRNLLDTCHAQLTHRIIDLHHELGRSPSASEFRAKYSGKFMTAIVKVYGTWLNAKAQCGLESAMYRINESRQVSRERTLAAMCAYFETHGRLPSSSTVGRRRCVPVVPSHRAILRSMGAKSWSEAMERVAALLDIHGGRYGLPVREKAS